MILEAYDRRKELSLNNKEYRKDVLNILNLMLNYDLKNNDITANALIDKKIKIKAAIIAKEKGIISGIEEISFFLRRNNVEAKLLKKDGDIADANERIAILYGNARKIFSLERTCLNVMQRMSGISTKTNSLAKRAGNDAKIAGTRKTILGPLEHKAITLGRGLSHRLGLYDSVLIKGNHLGLLDKNLSKDLFFAIASAASKRGKSRFIEIEASSPSMAILAAEHIHAIRRKTRTKMPFIVMLDNFSPGAIRKTLKGIKKKHLRHILIEASGGINEKNIKKYCIKGVDVISMGSLTNSSSSLDMSIRVLKQKP